MSSEVKEMDVLGELCPCQWLMAHCGRRRLRPHHRHLQQWSHGQGTRQVEWPVQDQSPDRRFRSKISQRASTFPLELPSAPPTSGWRGAPPTTRTTWSTWRPGSSLGCRTCRRRGCTSPAPWSKMRWWVHGAEGRMVHGPLTFQGGERELVVAGGYYSPAYFDGTEIFNFGSWSWREGPRLPHPLHFGEPMQVLHFCQT